MSLEVRDNMEWQPIETAPKDGTRILWCCYNVEHSRGPWFYSVIYWPDYEDCWDNGFWIPLPDPPEDKP